MSFEYKVRITAEVTFQSDSEIPEADTSPGTILWCASQIIGESALTSVISLTGRETGTILPPNEDERRVNVTFRWEIVSSHPEKMDSLNQKEPNEGENE